MTAAQDELLRQYLAREAAEQKRGRFVVLADRVARRYAPTVHVMAAATFLPGYISALFWKRATRIGVTSGMLAGLATWAGWVLFFHEKE